MEETFFFLQILAELPLYAALRERLQVLGLTFQRRANGGGAQKKIKKKRKYTKITKKKKSAVETKPLRDIDILCRRRAASRPAPAY